MPKAEISSGRPSLSPQHFTTTLHHNSSVSGPTQANYLTPDCDLSLHNHRPLFASYSFPLLSTDLPRHLDIYTYVCIGARTRDDSQILQPRHPSINLVAFTLRLSHYPRALFSATLQRLPQITLTSRETTQSTATNCPDNP